MRWLLRLLGLPLVLLAANAAGFLLAQAAASDRQARLGLEPLAPPLSYGAYLAGLLRGDLGPLPYGGSSQRVAALVGQAALASLGLICLSMLLSLALGLALGRLAVRRDPPGVATWLTGLTTVGLATPGFYLGSLLIAGALLSILYGPGTGADLPLPIQGFGWDRHIVLPTLVLLLLPTARIAQVTAVSLAAELGRQYVVAARSVGHRWPTIVGRYAMRNVVAPVAAAATGVLRLLVCELIVVERIFAWPGLGQLTARVLVAPAVVQIQTAPLFLHPPTLAALLMAFAALFALADLAAAAVAERADPLR